MIGYTRILPIGLVAGMLLAATSAQAVVRNTNVTPDVFFGTGNGNGGFDVETNADAGIELGIRAKLRFDTSDNNRPKDIFNNNGDGTASFAAGTPTIPGPNLPGWASATTPIWSVEFSVNSNVNGNGGNLDIYLYEWGLDFDPSSDTSLLLAFDPVRALGDNSYGNNTTDETTDSVGTFAALGASNNVAQNSQNYEFLNEGPFSGFDPNLDGTYTMYLAAFDLNGAELARVSMDIIIGAGAPVPEPATLALFGLGLAGLGLARKRRRTA